LLNNISAGLLLDLKMAVLSEKPFGTVSLKDPYIIKGLVHPKMKMMSSITHLYSLSLYH